MTIRLFCNGLKTDKFFSQYSFVLIPTVHIVKHSSWISVALCVLFWRIGIEFDMYKYNEEVIGLKTNKM